MATFMPRPEKLSDRLRQTGLYVSLLLLIAIGYVAFYGSLVVAGGLFLLAAGIAVLSLPFHLWRRDQRDLYIYSGAEAPLAIDLEITANGDGSAIGNGDETPVAEFTRQLPPGDGVILTNYFEPDRRYTVSVALRGGREFRTDVVPAKSTANDDAEAPYVEIGTAGIRSGWHSPGGPQFSSRVTERVSGTETAATDSETTLYHDW